MKKEKLLISSCLLGELVKYNGHHNLLDEEPLKELEKRYTLYPFCPEVKGGLLTPRTPCEIISTDPLKVINSNKEDKTKEFLEGAKNALELCKKEKITKALLKANSPSCGNRYIYDGTFSGNKIKGSGVTTKLLKDTRIEVFSEEEIEKLFTNFSN